MSEQSKEELIAQAKTGACRDSTAHWCSIVLYVLALGGLFFGYYEHDPSFMMPSLLVFLSLELGRIHRRINAILEMQK